MAKRANAKTVEVKSSHVAYMSHPKETAKLIEEAATFRVWRNSRQFRNPVVATSLPSVATAPRRTPAPQPKHDAGQFSKPELAGIS